MANLNVENLNRIVQTGDTEAMFGGGIAPTPSPAQELKTAREMQVQGMDAPAAADNAKTFSEVLRNSVDQVNQYQHQADTAIDNLISGRTKNIHETMLSIERADTSLKLMMQVRNKILDAYREIMRMQV